MPLKEGGGLCFSHTSPKIIKPSFDVFCVLHSVHYHKTEGGGIY